MKKKILIVLGVSAFSALLFIGISYVIFLRVTKRTEELSKDLKQRITEWEKKEYKHPPLFGPAIPGNAVEYYKEAFTTYKEVAEKYAPAELSDIISDAIESPDKSISPELKSYLEHNTEVFEIVEKGANAETYKSLLNIRDFMYSIPPLSIAKTMSRLMALKGRELEKDNHFQEALELYCTVIRFGNDYMGDGSISALMGEYMSNIGQDEIQRILLNAKLSEQNLIHLIQLFKILFNSTPSLQDVLETEKLGMEAFIELNRNPEGKPIFPTTFTSFGILSLYRLWAWDDIIFFYSEAQRLYSLPYSKANDELEELDTKRETLKNPLSRMLLPNFAGAHKKYYKSQANMRGIYILTALQLYKLKHQKYPEKLSDLAPDIIQDVPLDPFSDQSFIYKVNPDGTIMLYSVGENLKDDNGDEKRNNDIVIAR